MEAQAAALTRRDPGTLTRLIRRSVEIKAEVVSDDEREAGRRAILNAGHTVAHALEQVSNYGLPHGEAVALGLVVECELAEQLGMRRPASGRGSAALLSRLGLPEQLPPGLDPAALIEQHAADKKNRGGQIHFAFPPALGRMHRGNGWTTAVPAEAIRSALTARTALQ